MWPHRRQPTRLLRPWDSPGKNTGVGCHFLLQCMKVKSESEFAQSCLTPSNPMDCSPPGSSIHGIFQARVQEWVAIAFSEARGTGGPLFWRHWMAWCLTWLSIFNDIFFPSLDLTLQCTFEPVRVLAAQSCPALCDPVDGNLPGSSVRGDSPGKNTDVGSHSLHQGIFPTPGLPHYR